MWSRRNLTGNTSNPGPRQGESAEKITSSTEDSESSNEKKGFWSIKKRSGTERGGVIGFAKDLAPRGNILVLKPGPKLVEWIKTWNLNTGKGRWPEKEGRETDTERGGKRQVGWGKGNSASNLRGNVTGMYEELAFENTSSNHRR